MISPCVLVKGLKNLKSKLKLISVFNDFLRIFSDFNKVHHLSPFTKKLNRIFSYRYAKKCYGKACLNLVIYEEFLNVCREFREKKLHWRELELKEWQISLNTSISHTTRINNEQKLCQLMFSALNFIKQHIYNIQLKRREGPPGYIIFWWL